MTGTAPQLPLATKVMGGGGSLADSREQLSAGMRISPGGKQGPLSGLRARGLKWLPGGLADGRSSGKQRWVQGRQGLQCPLRKCQGWEGRSQQTHEPTQQLEKVGSERVSEK